MLQAQCKVAESEVSCIDLKFSEDQLSRVEASLESLEQRVPMDANVVEQSEASSDLIISSEADHIEKLDEAHNERIHEDELSRGEASLELLEQKVPMDANIVEQAEARPELIISSETDHIEKLDEAHNERIHEEAIPSATLGSEDSSDDDSEEDSEEDSEAESERNDRPKEEVAPSSTLDSTEESEQNDRPKQEVAPSSTLDSAKEESEQVDRPKQEVAPSSTLDSDEDSEEDSDDDSDDDSEEGSDEDSASDEVRKQDSEEAASTEQLQRKRSAGSDPDSTDTSEEPVKQTHVSEVDRGSEDSSDDETRESDEESDSDSQEDSAEDIPDESPSKKSHVDGVSLESSTAKDAQETMSATALWRAGILGLESPKSSPSKVSQTLNFRLPHSPAFEPAKLAPQLQVSMSNTAKGDHPRVQGAAHSINRLIETSKHKPSRCMSEGRIPPHQPDARVAVSHTHPTLSERPLDWPLDSLKARARAPAPLPRQVTPPQNAYPLKYAPPARDADSWEYERIIPTKNVVQVVKLEGKPYVRKGRKEMEQEIVARSGQSKKGGLNGIYRPLVQAQERRPPRVQSLPSLPGSSRAHPILGNVQLGSPQRFAGIA
jgi:hypothetical protein